MTVRTKAQWHSAIVTALAVTMSSAFGTTVSWQHASNRDNDNWDFVSQNWQGGASVYADGYDVVFDNGLVVDAGPVNIVSDVAPASVSFFGQRNNQWYLAGADITGPTAISVGLNRRVNFSQENLSFSGGLTVTNASVNFAPISGPATTHALGTGNIMLNNATFIYDPVDAGEPIVNNFIVESGGGILLADDMTGTVTLRGTLQVGRGGTAREDRRLDADVILEGNHTISIPWRDAFDGSVTSGAGGPYDVAFQSALGGNDDWRSYLNASSIDASVRNVRMTGFSQLRIEADETTLFQNIGGKVMVENGRIMTSGLTTFNATADYELYERPFVNGTSQTGTIYASSTINVTDGGTVSGTGRLQASTVNVGTGGTPGTLAPGLSIGTLIVAGNLVLGSDAISVFEFDGIDSDTIDVAGNLTLGGTLATNGYVYPEFETLFTFTGTATGEFDSVTGLAHYLHTVIIDIDNAAGEVRFAAIPEPGTFVLAALGGLLLFRRRRR